jgi:endonuclease III-like uncharacterized protein
MEKRSTKELKKLEAEISGRYDRLNETVEEDLEEKVALRKELEAIRAEIGRRRQVKNRGFI